MKEEVNVEHVTKTWEAAIVKRDTNKHNGSRDTEDGNSMN